MAKLYCIGCGPGDPELITLKAAKILKKCDVIFCPTSRAGRESMALSIVKPILSKRKKQPEIIELIFPMVRDKDILEETWRKNADDIAKKCKSAKNVVYLCVGDPSLYSTFSHIHKKLKDIEIEIIPGVASLFSFAAEAKMNLVEGDQTLAMIPACYDLERIRKAASCDTLVFLKDGKYFSNVIKLLKESGFSSNSLIAIAENVSSDREVVKVSKLSEVSDTSGSKYFSIMVVKRA